MGKTKILTDKSIIKRQKPATTPEGREQQMIAYAEALAEQQLRDGTASSQLITHYLKLGTEKAKLEREMMEEQKKLLQAKTESLKTMKNIEELYSKAVESMKVYSGQTDDEIEED